MKGAQVARIFNARKYGGHRCWRYEPGRGGGMVTTLLTGCKCGLPPEQHCAIPAVAVARWMRGEIAKEDVALAYHDMANRPEPE